MPSLRDALNDGSLVRVPATVDGTVGIRDIDTSGGTIPVAGTVDVSGSTVDADVSGSTVAVSSMPAITIAAAQTIAAITSVTNPVDTRPSTVTGAPTVSRVATDSAAGTGSAQLIAANSNRRGLIIFNEAAVALLIKFGTTASATDYTYSIPAGQGWTMPLHIPSTRIDGILASGVASNAQVTEW